MNHAELKEAREKLGLTLSEAAHVLDTASKTVSRMESAPDNKTHRKPPVRVVRLYQAYLAGYRPDDWPERLQRREERLAELEKVRAK